MDRHKSLTGIGLILALMALTGFLLFRNQPLSQLAQLLGELRPGWLALGLGFMLAFVGCEAMCSRLILARLGHRAPYRRCLGYSFVGFYVSSITPSATGGQPAQVYYMSRDGIPPAHGALNMMLIAVCYQVVVLGHALMVILFRFDLAANLGTGLGLLLLFGALVNGLLTAGMLGLMFLPAAARRLTGGVLRLLARVGLVRNETAAREKLDRQMEEYRRGAECVRRNPGLVPVLLGITFLQLTALFAVPLAVYHAFGLSGSGAMDLIATQALVTLAVANLPLPGGVGASEGSFVAAMKLFFGAGLVTPAVLVSRGISFYAFLVLSGGVALTVHLRSRRRPSPAASPKLPKPARGAVVT